MTELFYCGKCEHEDCTEKVAFSRCSTCRYRLCKNCFENGKGRPVIKGKCVLCVPRTMYSYKLLVEKPVTSFDLDPKEFSKEIEFLAKTYLIDKMDAFYEDWRANPRVQCIYTKRRVFIKGKEEKDYILVKKEKIE